MLVLCEDSGYPSRLSQRNGQGHFIAVKDKVSKKKSLDEQAASTGVLHEIALIVTIEGF